MYWSAMPPKPDRSCHRPLRSLRNCHGSATTPSFVSNVIRPGDTARKATNTAAQKPTSQRRDRGSGDRPEGGPPAAGRAGGRVWTALVMNTAGE